MPKTVSRLRASREINLKKVQQQLFEIPQTISPPPYLKPLLDSSETLLAINLSGGKDSQALLNSICRQNYNCQIIAIHADVGEVVEWPGTKQFIQQLCDRQFVPLKIVQRLINGKPQNLFDYILQRQKQRNGAVFWMTAASRYCTSTFKTAPINKFLRKYQTVINVTGIRGDESTPRRMKPPIKPHAICSKHYKNLSLKESIHQHLDRPLGRLAIDWKPIFYWNLDRVWRECGTSTTEWERRRKIKEDPIAIEGWPAHYAYVIGKGNTRLSCAFCMLANRNDLSNAIPYNPVAYKFITDLERQSGYSFQQKQFLSAL